MDIEMMMQFSAYALGIATASAMLFIGYQYVIPYLKAKIGNEQYLELETNIKTLIAAVEDKYGPGEGALKKQWVINELKRLGFEFDEEVVSNFIDGFCSVMTADGVINRK
jgi:hypothetical protein